MERTFQVSSDLFWGYQQVIDVSLYETLEEICSEVKKRLKQFFVSHHLLALAEKVDKMKLHMHAPIQTIEDVFVYTTPETILYLCDHC